MAFRISYSTPLPVSNNFGLYAQTEQGNAITGIVPQDLIGNGVGVLTIPAKRFVKGDSFLAEFSGYLSAQNNEILRIIIYTTTPLGNIILADTLDQTMPNVANDVWNLILTFTIREIGGVGVASIVSSGEFHYSKSSNNTQRGFGFITTNNTTFDTEVDNNLKVVAYWGSNDTGNIIQTETFILNKIY